MKRLLLLTALLCVLASPLAAQVPVSPSPPIKLQFLSNAGIPLASGCLFSYQAGTSTPASTYADSTGVTVNANPTILDGGGRANVWIPNAAFKFTLKSAGGVNCASGSTIWTVDGVTGVLGFLNLNNIFTGTNQFNQAIIINVNTNQIQAGTVGNRTTLNFPAPAGNVTLNLPNTTDTIPGRATTDTLTNKTLTSPILTTPIISGGMSAVASTTLPITTSGDSSNITLTAGNGVSVIGGSVNLTAGNGTSGAGGGQINITAGNGASTNAGLIAITAGSGTANNLNGADISLTPGSPNGAGARGKVKIGGGIASSATNPGLQHVRQTTGSIGATTRAEVLVTWPITWADTSYTASCMVNDAVSGAAVTGMIAERIRTVNSNQTGIIVNNTTAGPLTGTLHCIGMHD